MSMVNDFLGHSPEELRGDTRNDRGGHMRRRRGTVAVSLLGIGAMAFTSMLQMGMVRRLPDPPIRRFNTKKVNLSKEAFSYGGPDSPIVILMHAINMVLATTGGADRARHHPWLPLLAAGLSGAQSAMAAKYRFLSDAICRRGILPLLHRRCTGAFCHAWPGSSRSSGSGRRTFRHPG